MKLTERQLRRMIREETQGTPTTISRMLGKLKTILMLSSTLLATVRNPTFGSKDLIDVVDLSELETLLDEIKSSSNLAEKILKDALDEIL